MNSSAMVHSITPTDDRFYPVWFGDGGIRVRQAYWDRVQCISVRLATVVSGLAGVMISVPACCGL